MAMSYTRPGSAVTHKMVTTQFELDGFRVVSAMRSAQPRCVNVILTGYPALEPALQAIRSEVDDYLVKPADVDTIIKVLRKKLACRRKSEA